MIISTVYSDFLFILDHPIWKMWLLIYIDSLIHNKKVLLQPTIQFQTHTALPNLLWVETFELLKKLDFARLLLLRQIFLFVLNHPT